jgi:NAD(P)H-dependent FMN reductase
MNENKILVIAGSNSSMSINQSIASKLSLLDNVDYYDTRLLDAPYYSYDIETSSGIPQEIISFYDKIHQYSKLVLVCPEYNGYTPSFIKSILDWLSRYNRFYLENIDLVIVATTPGKAAGASVRSMLKTMLSFTNANILGDYGIGEYDPDKDYSKELKEIVAMFK